MTVEIFVNGRSRKYKENKILYSPVVTYLPPGESLRYSPLYHALRLCVVRLSRQIPIVSVNSFNYWHL